MSMGEYLGAGSATTKGLYHLNGNSNDSSGNSYNGTDSNISYVDGRFGQCASFNGSSYLDSYLYFNSTNITISTWIYNTNALDEVRTIVSQGAYTSKYPTLGINIYFQRAGSIVFWYGNGTSASENTHWIETDAGLITNNKWYNIICTRRSSDGLAKIYINGKFIKSANLTTSMDSTGATFQIGRWRDGDPKYFTGRIDETIVDYQVWDDSMVSKYYTMAKGRFGIV